MGSGKIAKVALVCSFASMLAGCIAPTQPAGTPTARNNPTTPSIPGELRGQGTVLQRRPAEPIFCLGLVTASDPPRCSGPAIANWNWNSVSGSRTIGTVTHGDYLLQGTWDGKTFTLGQTPPRALGLNEYVQGPRDPRREAAHRGAGTPDQLRKIRNELSKDSDPALLEVVVENGYVFLTVIHDDGKLQKKWTEPMAQKSSPLYQHFGQPLKDGHLTGLQDRTLQRKGNPGRDSWGGLVREEPLTPRFVEIAC